MSHRLQSTRDRPFLLPLQQTKIVSVQQTGWKDVSERLSVCSALSTVSVSVCVAEVSSSSASLLVSVFSRCLMNINL